MPTRRKFKLSELLTDKACATEADWDEPKCPHCGGAGHRGVCHMVKAIEYHPDGSVKRVEYKTAVDFTGDKFSGDLAISS